MVAGCTLNPDGPVNLQLLRDALTDGGKGTAIVVHPGILERSTPANGLTTFGISWGITTGAKSIKRAEILALVFGILLLALGYASIAGFSCTTSRSS